MLQIWSTQSQYTRGVALASCLSTRCCSKYGFLRIENQLMVVRSAKARSHVIYTDTDLNGSHTVHVNVYQNFIVSAMKMHHYLMAWGIDVGKNTKLLRGELDLHEPRNEPTVLITYRCHWTHR
jgi:hypothetical protein